MSFVNSTTKRHQVSTQNRIKPLYALDALRGFAAFSIVSHHISLYFLPQINTHIIHESPYFVKSYLWVDFFFILSGFILTYIHGNHFYRSISLKNYRSFILKRLYRFYPLHLLTLGYLVLLETIKLFILKAGLTIAEASQTFPLPFSGKTSISSIFTNIALVQAFQAWSYWNEPAWFNSALFFVYLSIPLSIFTLSRLSFRIQTVLLLLASLPLIAFVFRYGTLDFVTFRSIIRAFCDTYIGIFIYFLFMNNRLSRIFKSKWLFAVIFSITLMTMALPVNHLITIAFFPLLILSGAVLSYSDGFLSKSRILIYLGKISYSVFMVHWPVIQTFKLIALSITNQGINTLYKSFTQAALAGFGTLIFILMIAWLSYQYIERPIRGVLLSHSS